MSATLSTHVLDTALGVPAAGLPVELSESSGDGWRSLRTGVTNADGRAPSLGEGLSLVPGTYRVRFDTSAYHAAVGVDGFYPYVEVVFRVRQAGHHHVPLLISPFGYSTYRGS